MRVVVLGAGVIGTTTAYELARAGLEVTVVDREQDSGRGASFANGALLTASTSDSWAAPGTPWKILKWLGQADAPIRLRPSARPGMIGWGLRYLRECDPARWRANTIATFRLAHLSLQAHEALCAALPLDFDHNPKGLLKLFRDEFSMTSAVRAAELYRELGLPLEILDADSAVGAEPALAPIRHKITGAVLYPSDGSGDAFQFTQALAERCRDMGVEFRHGVTVEALESDADRVTAARTSVGRLTADRWVLALGAHSPVVARTIGLGLPIYPAKGYSATIEVAGWNRKPRIAIADDGLKVGVVPLGQRIRVAGTVEFDGYALRREPAREQMLTDALSDILPEAPTSAPVRFWAGLRPLTPDGRPILGATRFTNLFLNTGHGPLGWTLACGSALALAELVAGRLPPIDLAPFAWPRGRAFAPMAR